MYLRRALVKQRYKTMKIKKWKQFIKRAAATIKYAFVIYGNCEYCQHSDNPGREYPCKECLDSEIATHFKVKDLAIRALYICDREKHKPCNPDCEYTRDIKHAANFYEDNGYYLEQPPEV